MVRVLVAGKGSYIGKAFCQYIKQWSDAYVVDSVGMRGGEWRGIDFSMYDVVFYVAGIAHQKETQKNADLYFAVNRNLTIEVAREAKNAGVRQFIFLSTISVYGLNEGIISNDTILKPVTNYGKSKLEAEQILHDLADDVFSVAIIRPPMVYGKNCKGNFAKLVELVGLSPVFPDMDNKRSMIYIDNLCEFIRLCIDERLKGCYIPQNKEPVDICNMVKLIASYRRHRIVCTKLFNPAIKAIKKYVPAGQKAFSDLSIVGVEKFDFRYCVVGFEDSIARSVGVNG